LVSGVFFGGPAKRFLNVSVGRFFRESSLEKLFKAGDYPIAGAPFGDNKYIASILTCELLNVLEARAAGEQGSVQVRYHRNGYETPVPMNESMVYGVTLRAGTEERNQGLGITSFKHFATFRENRRADAKATQRD